MARILIVGGGCRGRRFAEAMVEQGHAVRATTRTEAGRPAIEATDAECWIGTPDRLATLRGALENVTIACWMLACARGSQEQIAPLFSSRLEFFLSQAIDTTARGLIYDAWAVPGRAGGMDGAGGTSGAPDTSADARRPCGAMLAEGARIFRSLTELNSIPALVLGGSGARPSEGGRSSEGEGPNEGEGDGEDARSGEERRERGEGEGPHSEDLAWVAAACDAVTTLLGGDR